MTMMSNTEDEDSAATGLDVSGSEADTDNEVQNDDEIKVAVLSDESQNRNNLGQLKHKKSDKPQHKSKVKIKTLTIDGQLVYFCKICDKVFTRRKDKLNHELAHSGESVLSCTECGKEYLHESSLASHMKTHDGDQLYMCDLCPKMFAQSHHLKTHILSHTEPNDFTCKTCQKEFATVADLSHHCRIETKNEMTQYWCKMCKVYFCRLHDLQSENQLHAFCCSACNELFFTSKKLKIHMKKFAHQSKEKVKYIKPLQEHELYPDKMPPDGNKKNFINKDKAKAATNISQEINLSSSSYKRPHHATAEVEGEMSKKFKLPKRFFVEAEQSSTSLQDSAPEIKEESRKDTKSPMKHRKPYCKKCNKSFKDIQDLEKHKASMHEEKQNLLTCEVCGIEFSAKEEFDRHSLKHIRECKHTCPMCGKDFPHSLQLTKHLRSHTSDYSYKCNTCSKAFRLKIQLVQHIRLHSVPATNCCDKCPSKFRTKQDLQEHISQVHSEMEPFRCHLCSKTFSFRYKLVNHLRLHTNVKCFQCYICHKSFATKHYLQRHLQVHIKQGMDVDVKNIIVDEDSKMELDSVKDHHVRLANESLSREECNEDKQTHHFRKDVEEFRQSSLHLGPTANGTKPWLSSGRHTTSNNENSTERLFFPCLDTEAIKLEVKEEKDTASEHSFCSSFTRDSERSDPFRFSSDGSDSFKTTMAKERRRLRRRWKKSQLSLVLQKKIARLSQAKRQEALAASVDVNHEVKSEHDGDDTEHPADIDMMVELNGVREEADNVTTIYVNLREINLSTKKQEHETRQENSSVSGLTTGLSVSAPLDAIKKEPHGSKSPSLQKCFTKSTDTASKNAFVLGVTVDEGEGNWEYPTSHHSGDKDGGTIIEIWSNVCSMSPSRLIKDHDKSESLPEPSAFLRTTSHEQSSSQTVLGTSQSSSGAPTSIQDIALNATNDEKDLSSIIHQSENTIATVKGHVPNISLGQSHNLIVETGRQSSPLKNPRSLQNENTISTKTNQIDGFNSTVKGCRISDSLATSMPSTTPVPFLTAPGPSYNCPLNQMQAMVSKSSELFLSSTSSSSHKDNKMINKSSIDLTIANSSQQEDTNWNKSPTANVKISKPQEPQTMINTVLPIAPFNSSVSSGAQSLTLNAANSTGVNFDPNFYCAPSEVANSMSCLVGVPGGVNDIALPLHPDSGAAQLGNVPMNPPAVFDTNNPILRNMNMMDLVSSTAEHSLNAMTQELMQNMHHDRGLDMIQQSSTTGSIAHQRAMLQPNPLLNLINTSMPFSSGNIEVPFNPQNQISNTSNYCFNNGIVDNSCLNIGQNIVSDTFLSYRNVPGPALMTDMGALTNVAQMGFPTTPLGVSYQGGVSPLNMNAGSTIGLPPLIGFGHMDTSAPGFTNMPGLNHGSLHEPSFNNTCPGPQFLGSMPTPSLRSDSRFPGPSLGIGLLSTPVALPPRALSQVNPPGYINPAYFHTMPNFPYI